MISLLKREQAMQVQDHVTLQLRQIIIKPEILLFRIEVSQPSPYSGYGQTKQGLIKLGGL